MLRVLILLFFWLLPNVSVAMDGYVHGDNHCFYFSTPKNWIADNNAGKTNGLAFVFYPAGGSWSNSTTVIYTRVIDKSVKINTPEDVVEDTLNLFHTKYQSPNAKASKVESIKSDSGESGEIYKFSGDVWRNYELVSYFTAKDTINYFVMTSCNESDLQKHKGALYELVKSYRSGNDCVPCSQTTITSACSGPG